jgi:hypothetical protein
LQGLRDIASAQKNLLQNDKNIQSSLGSAGEGAGRAAAASAEAKD